MTYKRTVVRHGLVAMALIALVASCVARRSNHRAETPPLGPGAKPDSGASERAPVNEGATIRTVFERDRFAAYVDSNGELKYRFRYLAFDKTDKIKFTSGRGVLEIRSLPVGIAGELSLELFETDLVKMRGIEKNYVLKAGANSLTLTLTDVEGTADLVLTINIVTVPPPDPSAEAGGDNVVYAQRCAREMGLDPAKLQDLSCLAGIHNDIKFDGRVVTAVAWAEFAAQGRKCDNPHWLSSACYLYDFVQMREEGDVQILMNCRQKYFADEHLEDPALNSGMGKFQRLLAFSNALESRDEARIDKYRKFAFLFNDMGVILRSKSSGKVCYFTNYGEDFFGGFVPSPLRASPPDPEAFKRAVRSGITAGLSNATDLSAADKQKVERLADDPALSLETFKKTANTFYFEPSATGSCAACHAYGGYKYSPFIKDSGALPPISQLSGTPFLPIGSEVASALRDAVEVKVDADATCTSCHRLVSQGSAGNRSCNSFDRVIGAFTDNDLGRVHTVRANSYPMRAWMPLGHGKPSEAAYIAAHKPTIDAARCCCEHPSANGCSWKRFGPTSGEVDREWRIGKAPSRELEEAIGIGDDTGTTCR